MEATKSPWRELTRGDGTPSGVFVRDASETEKKNAKPITREPEAEVVACRNDVVEFHQPAPFQNRMEIGLTTR